MKDTRLYEVGDMVKTKGGTTAEVIGSAIYPYLGNCYRLKAPTSKRTFYRMEPLIKGKVEDLDETLTIFRKFKQSKLPYYNDIIALFPEIYQMTGKIMSYMHVGQHSMADYHHVINKTKPANPEEYQDLKTELESMGYNLKVRRKWIRSRSH